MTYPTWPAELPKPITSGYQHQRADVRRVTTFDNGPPKRSRRSSRSWRTISLTFNLYLWQAQIFDRFYQDDCAEGVSYFWIPDHMIDGVPLLDELNVPLLDEADSLLLDAKLMLCAWGDSPPVFSNPVIRRQQVSFQIVEMP